MNKVALVIIFNHQYNQNIEIIERIYRNRFSHIYHLVPFYTGEKENVIPVYCSSHYFQGYVAEGFKSYERIEFEHYFFIADDLILNPLINENNYKEYLHLTSVSCFIPRLSSVSESKNFWSVNFHALLYDGESPGVEAKSQLPSYAEAENLLKKHGVQNEGLTFEQIWAKPSSFMELFKMVAKDRRYFPRLLKSKLTNKQRRLAFPLVRSYSDIFVVSADTIKQFAHLCGVTAATRLFVELAVPTAMVFSAKKIVTEKDLELRGTALWTREDLCFLDKYQKNLKNLLENFPEGHLYIHPVKLSKWQTNL